MAIGSRLIIRRLWPLKPTDIIRGPVSVGCNKVKCSTGSLIIRNFIFYFILQSAGDAPQFTSEIAKIKSTGAGASYFKMILK